MLAAVGVPADPDGLRISEDRGVEMLFPLESSSHLPDPNSSPLGQEYVINDAGQVSPINSAGSPGGPGSSSHSGGSTPTHSSTPAPYLVTVTGSNLQIDLIWDSSVANAPSGFTAAVIDAAQFYVTNFTSSTGGKTVLYIDVGYGEIAGTSLAANALGESESNGYLTNYSTVTKALAADGYSFSATNEPTGSQFFVTSAQAKSLGLISGTSGGASSVDGYIGFSTLTGTGYSWNTYANPNGSNSGTTSTQFDLQAVVEHEISEVMGRIGMEGQVINGKATYTPLDLFNYASYNTTTHTGALELSGHGGYFSTNGGATKMGVFNNSSSYGGDIADWASYTSVTQSATLPVGAASNVSDAYDAFLAPADNGLVTTDDILVDAAIGYKLTTAGAILA